MSHPNERQKHTDYPVMSMALNKDHLIELHRNVIDNLRDELRQAREQIESLKEHNLQLYDTMVERGKQVERLKRDGERLLDAVQFAIHDMAASDLEYESFESLKGVYYNIADEMTMAEEGGAE